MKTKHPPLEDATLQGYLDVFEEHLRNDGSGRNGRSVAQYRLHLRKYFAYLIATRQAFTTESFRSFLHHYQDEGSRPRTLNSYLVTARMFCRFLKATGRMENPPNLAEVKRPRFDPPQRYAVSDEEMAALFKAAAGLPRSTPGRRFQNATLQAILAILAYTGIRRKELLSLNLDDILRSSEGWELRIRTGKGGVYRTVPIQADLRRYLEYYLHVREEWVENTDHGTRPAFRPEAARALFPANTRQRRGDHFVDLMFDEVKAIAGLADRPITPHCLRAWFVTRCAASVDIVTAARLAGHASVRTTLDHYLKTDNQRMRAAVTALNVPGVGKLAPNAPPAAPEFMVQAAPMSGDAWRQVI
jgi:integrase